MTIRRIGIVFEFSPPHGWRLIHEEPGREYFEGPNGEELVLHAWIVQGFGKTDDLTKVREQLRENAVRSIEKAASHPDLRIFRPFQRDTHGTIVEHWSLLAETRDGKTLFYQTAFFDLRGVLLVTLEGQRTDSLADIYRRFVQSVSVSPT